MSKNKNSQKFWSLKRIFYVPKFTTKTICVLGLLIAVTIVLSYLSRILLSLGPYSKLTISFIPVFIIAYLYGGFAGGFASVIADLISFLVFGGSLIVPFTIIEFVYGFMFGFFFHKTSNITYLQKTIICNVIQLISNAFLKTYIFSKMFTIDFRFMFGWRMLVCIIQMIIIIIFTLSIKAYLNKFKKFIK